jgi:hypothetical protein
VDSTSGSALEIISSASTGFWRDLFPPIWTGAVGIGMLGIWFEWFGDPASMELKLLGAFLWAGTSILFRFGTKALREVWLSDSELIVSSDGHKVRIPLSEVREIKETRGQKVKTIRILLRGESRVGSEIRFIPVHRGQVPFTDHPAVQKLRQRMMEIKGEGRADRARLP